MTSFQDVCCCLLPTQYRGNWTEKEKIRVKKLFLESILYFFGSAIIGTLIKLLYCIENFGKCSIKECPDNLNPPPVCEVWGFEWSWMIDPFEAFWGAVFFPIVVMTLWFFASRIKNCKKHNDYAIGSDYELDEFEYINLEEHGKAISIIDTEPNILERRIG